MTAIFKKCCVCGSAYTSYNSQQKYCSKKCQNNSPTRKKTTKEFSKKRRELLDKIKLDTGCEECGYNKHPAALHFDHIDPSNKSFTISQDVKRKWSDIENEINKCRVLCANCHSIYTHNENHYRNNR